MIYCDITEPVCQVRLKIADASNRPQFSDETIQQFLDKNSGDVFAAAIELLIYCISVASGRARERVDDVEVDWPAIYRQKKDLLHNLQTNSDYGANIALHILGGTSKSEMERVCNDSDGNSLSVTVGEFSNIEEDIERYYADYRN